MSNEEYWKIHVVYEKREEFRRKHILLAYPTHKPPHDGIRFEYPDVMLIEALDEKQKRGRLIVGGQRNERKKTR